MSEEITLLVRSKSGEFYCRICARIPITCQKCFHRFCESCSYNKGRCEHCQRPIIKVATNKLPFHIAAITKAEKFWRSETYLASWLGTSPREIRRAIKRIDNKLVRIRPQYSSRGRRSGYRRYYFPNKDDR